MASSSNVRILIVDDSAVWRAFLMEHLYDSGLGLVYVAYDGVQAVHKARTLQPDVILMDVSLPHKNGIEAAAEISVAVPTAKIVFVSNNDDPQFRRAAMEAGGYDYVLKSMAGHQLMGVIMCALRNGAGTA